MKKTFTLLMALALVTSLFAEVQGTQWYSMNFTDGQGSWTINNVQLPSAVAPVLKVNHALNKGAGTNMRTKVSTNGGSTWTDLSLTMPAGSSWGFQDNTVDMASMM